VSFRAISGNADQDGTDPLPVVQILQVTRLKTFPCDILRTG
jgi:hypothetical protein